MRTNKKDTVNNDMNTDLEDNDNIRGVGDNDSDCIININDDKEDKTDKPSGSKTLCPRPGRPLPI